LNAYIDQHRDTYRVEPICKVVKAAPSAYRRHAARQRNPSLRSARAKRDETLMPQIKRVWQANLEVYGADKVWKQLNREDVPVARCTVERLMQRLGLCRAHAVARRHAPRYPTARCRVRCTGSIDSSRRTGRSTVGIGLYLRFDLAGLAVCGLRHRRFRPVHRGLARQQHHDCKRLRGYGPLLVWNSSVNFFSSTRRIYDAITAFMEVSSKPR